MESEGLWVKPRHLKWFESVAIFFDFWYLPSTETNKWCNTTRRWKKCVYKVRENQRIICLKPVQDIMAEYKSGQNTEFIYRTVPGIASNRSNIPTNESLQFTRIFYLNLHS